ncbi:Mitochondrial distribution and morphology protein 12 [Rhizopus stolonifer]|uniref:Mitochondrial distribution and morphology protein 12 n=1 Tax=Rhizopus stolonifer TaxID=4846 RepID=A0A367KHZ7_RHIST|nr:Mitochondrial distribution and morphology protein 12 [Rhizopus stolonifer]
MSVDIDWKKLNSELAGHVQQFLNKHFQNIAKPSFIGDIEVTSFQWGNEAPQIEITSITDPFPEFYEDDDQQDHHSPTPSNSNMNSSSASLVQTSTTNLSPTPSEFYTDDGMRYNTARLSLNTPLSHQQRFNLMHSFHRSPLVAPQHPFSSYFASPTTISRPPSIEEDWIDDEDINHVSNPSIPPSQTTSTLEKKTTEMDFQVHMLISYKGDMTMTIMTELRMNYPSVMFMSLPIHLCVRSIEFEATAVVAYIQSMKRVCISMLEPEQDMTFSGRNKDIGMDSLLRDVHIETIVGDGQKQGILFTNKTIR